MTLWILALVLSLPLSQIQEGQLSVSSRSMCTSTGLLLRGLSLPRKSVSRLTDWLDMILTFTTLLATSAHDKLMIFFLFFPENRI